MLNSVSLNLDTYYYTEINVSVDIHAVEENESYRLTTENLIADFGVHQNLQKANEIILSLKVTTDAEAELALSVSVAVIGKFDVKEDLIEKVRSGAVKEEVLIENALSILYTSIREQVVSLTAKTPIGPQFMPTCNFRVQKTAQPQPGEKVKEARVKAEKKTKKPA